MTTNNYQPVNTNYLLPTSYSIVFSRIPQLTYNCNRVALPSIAIGNVDQKSPFAPIPHPAGPYTFGDLTIEWMLDENMETWKEIHEWMSSISNFNSLNAKEYSKWTSDLDLMITTNHKNPNLNFRFVGAFPISLSEIQFDSTTTDPQPIQVSATFKYMYYNLVRNTPNIEA